MVRLSIYLAVSILLIAADQLSKAAVASRMPLHHVFEVTPFLNIVHVLNPGAAFSFLADQQGWQRWFFVLLASVISIGLLILLKKAKSRLQSLSYSFVLAGAVGNLCDRLWRGAVVDWIDFHAMGAHFPAFNLADTWISIGFALLMFELLFRPERTRAS
ncbi:signal peptidase II [Asticcacaulis biprosthecium]|uniref:signal peptidase II n=1 Tax=Asticcacaulis biprosthecium TaxID=76891 RepID=UPI000680DE14|nr:signal peptidase II [Asticcacaulis biprosthecium]